jgi:hypothetical protein
VKTSLMYHLSMSWKGRAPMYEKIETALVIACIAGAAGVFLIAGHLIGARWTLGPPDHETRAAASAPLIFAE